MFKSGWVALLRNRGVGTATITPTTSTVNEVPTLVLAAIHLDAPHNSLARRLVFTFSAERLRASSAAA